MGNQPESYGEWLKQMKDFKGGWLGAVVILMTIVIGAVAGFYGIELFPAGSYPKIVLAIPGLIAGAATFFIASAALWPLKKPK